MRVFVAIDIPDEIRQRIGELVGKLRPLVRGARWARVEGTHVTLKFIGETSEEKVQRIAAELAGVRPRAAVEMHFRGVGFFPSEQYARVFWAGIEATPNLAEMATEIEQRLERLGTPRETRPFRPHLTLARFNSQDGLPELRRALERLAPFEFGSARTSEFHLYQSRLKPGGADYHRLQTFQFAGTAP